MLKALLMLLLPVVIVNTIADARSAEPSLREEVGGRDLRWAEMGFFSLHFLKTVDSLLLVDLLPLELRGFAVLALEEVDILVFILERRVSLVAGKTEAAGDAAMVAAAIVAASLSPSSLLILNFAFAPN
jgi:hypothetical protein